MMLMGIMIIFIIVIMLLVKGRKRRRRRRRRRRRIMMMIKIMTGAPRSGSREGGRAGPSSSAASGPHP
jgi:hypothetical protein